MENTKAFSALRVKQSTFNKVKEVKGVYEEFYEEKLTTDEFVAFLTELLLESDSDLKTYLETKTQMERSLREQRERSREMRNAAQCEEQKAE